MKLFPLIRMMQRTEENSGVLLLELNLTYSFAYMNKVDAALILALQRPQASKVLMPSHPQQWTSTAEALTGSTINILLKPVPYSACLFYNTSCSSLSYIMGLLTSTDSKFVRESGSTSDHEWRSLTLEDLWGHTPECCRYDRHAVESGADSCASPRLKVDPPGRTLEWSVSEAQSQMTFYHPYLITWQNLQRHSTMTPVIICSIWHPLLSFFSSEDSAVRQCRIQLRW